MDVNDKSETKPATPQSMNEEWRTRRDFWGVFPAEGFGDSVLALFTDRDDADWFVRNGPDRGNCDLLVLRVLPFDFTMVNAHEDPPRDAAIAALTSSEYSRGVRDGLERAARAIEDGIPGFTIHGFIKPGRAAATIRSLAAQEGREQP